MKWLEKALDKYPVPTIITLAVVGVGLAAALGVQGSVNNLAASAVETVKNIFKRVAA